ncbi:MAG: hypothetical protein ACUVS6_13680 [Anaerolineae bacterium]
MRIVLPIAIGLALLAGALTPVAALGVWPGEVVLWRGDTPVTQTVQSRAQSVIGANYVYLFYDTGYGSTSATATITVTRRWRGLTFQTLVASGEVSETLGISGVITVVAGAPYYPDVLVQVNVTTGTITPTIALVGQ